MRLDIPSQTRSYADSNSISKDKVKQNGKLFSKVIKENYTNENNNKISRDSLIDESKEEYIEELTNLIMNLINNTISNDSEKYDIENSNLLSSDINNFLDKYTYESMHETKNLLVEKEGCEINRIIKEAMEGNYTTENEFSSKSIEDILKEIFKKISDKPDNINQENIGFDYKIDNDKVKFGHNLEQDGTDLTSKENNFVNNKLIINKSILIDDNFDKNMNILQDIAKKNESSNRLFVSHEILNTSNISNGIKPESNQAITFTENFVAEDIAKSINYLQSNDLKELRVSLSPKELGDMVIKIIKNEKESKILITVSKEDIFNIVSKNIDEINKHLSDLDIKVKDVEVEIKSDNQNYFSDNSNREFEDGNSKKYYHDTHEKEDDIGISEDEKISEESINLLV